MPSDADVPEPIEDKDREKPAPMRQTGVDAAQSAARMLDLDRPSKPAPKPQEEKQEAAASSADATPAAPRRVRPRPEADEYDDPQPATNARVRSAPKPAPPAPPVRKSKFPLVIAAVVLFGAGAAIGSRVEKRKFNHVIITVNEDSISSDDFAHASEIANGRQTIQKIIDEHLVVQFAKQKKVVPDQKAIEAKYAEEAKTPDFFKKLRQANKSPEDFKHDILVALCRQAVVDNGISASPAEIKEYYDHNIDPKNPAARYYHPETVQIQVVVTKDEAEIQKAWKDLQAGLPFTTAVQKYSKDVSRRNNGLLPAIRKGTIVSSKFPGLEQTLFEGLGVNALVPPHQYQGTWWVIKCLSHVVESTDSFDKVQQECSDAVLYNKGIKEKGGIIKKEEEEFVKKSKIEITIPQYADMAPKKQ